MLEFKHLSLKYLSEIMSIEREVFAFPWSAAMMKDSLQAAHCESWGIFLDNKLIGFGVLSVVLDETELLDLVVCKELQGQGYGAALLDHLLMEAKRAQAQSIHLEVRLSHKAAIALYTKKGFKEMGRRRDYYPLGSDKREDAILMSMKL